VNILVLSKHKTDTTTQFVDASGLFKKETNNNVLLDEHIDQIMAGVRQQGERGSLRPVGAPEKIAANDYNLSVSSYVEAKDTREVGGHQGTQREDCQYCGATGGIANSD
jgi:type I restriction enzyme M protein